MVVEDVEGGGMVVLEEGAIGELILVQEGQHVKIGALTQGLNLLVKMTHKSEI